MSSLVPLPPSADKLKVNSRQIGIWVVMGIVIAIVAVFLPQGFDYVHVFSVHAVPVFFVPWTDGLLYLLSWPILVSLTIMSLVVAIHHYGGPKWLLILAIFSLPTIWVLLLGALEGITLWGILLLSYAVPVNLLDRLHLRNRRWWITLGLFIAATAIAAAILIRDQGPNYHFANSTVLGSQPQIGVALALLLPWVVPLVLLRPQLAAFALLARRSWLIVGVLWILLSIIVWGIWPPALLLKVTPDLKAAQPQNVSLFPWSLLFALPMLWWSRRDPDMLMAAGSFIAPSVIPYYYMILLPSLARLPVGYALLCWASSFLPLTANYFGPSWWLTANVFPLLIWLGLWWQRQTAQLAALAV